MSTVMDQILAWSATRPLWQQDALRRLVADGHVGEDVVVAYAGWCFGEEGLGLEPLDHNHVRSTNGEKEPVIVLGVRDGANVNSLAAGEHLTFSPTGLTIVYGDNGSGKSGYARILKSVSRTRASERVRSDIFREPTLVPHAVLEYQVGDAQLDFGWTGDGGGNEDLSRLSFFDRSCSAVYLARETDVAFRPFGLGLFDELVTVCERVRAELDRRAAGLGRRTSGLPDLDSATGSGTFIQTLAADTADEAIATATTLTDEERGRLELLREVDEDTRRGTAAAEADRLERLAARAGRMKDHIAQLGTEISSGTRDDLLRLRDDAAAKRLAAEAARKHAMSGAELDGIGDAAWRQLWEAARSYSETVAYPGKAFPVVDEALCVMCHQPIAADAAERLLGFERFVKETTQQAADAAELSYSSACQRLSSIRVREQATTDLLVDLQEEDPALADEVESYLEATERRVEELRRAVEAGTLQTVEAFPTPPLNGVEDCMRRTTERVAALRKSADGIPSAEAAEELLSLAAKEALANARDAVFTERDRLRALAAITAGKRAASTKSVTQKGVELTNEALTEVLIDRFSRETDRLGLEKVVLRTVGGRRGVLHYKTGFVGAVQDAPLPEVLSEGEQTALGMAGFLAEVWTDASKSGLVFDDPVNSLDHERRDKVAERLVSLAAERQTIVFTHDVAFVLALKKHAVRKSVLLTERSIERVHSTPGRCADFHKFSAKLVKERLHELEVDLSTIRTNRDHLSPDEYRDRTTKWYRMLRTTWERAIEETLVGEVLTRDDLQVHPAMVRTLVLYTAEDNKALQHGYGRATEFSAVHDESPVVNAPAPSEDDMNADLEALRQWHKRVAARRSLSEEKVYALAGQER